MDISGSHRIPAPRAAVWEALRDPDVLRDCIPGCEALEKTSGDAFHGAVGAKVGPMRARFAGEIAATGSQEAFRVTARGQDEKAGGGEGEADVTLVEEGPETVLSYACRFEANGKLSQLGGRLLTGVARTQIEAFFARFSETVAGRATAAGPLPHAEPVVEAPPLAPEAEPVGAAPERAPTFAEPPVNPAAIAPTAVPDAPGGAEIAAIEATEPAASGGGVVTRIMLVAAIVVVVAVGVYLFMLQPPAVPPA